MDVPQNTVLNIGLPADLAILLLDIYPTDIYPSVILRQVDRVPRGHQPHPETLLAVLTREERRVAMDIHGPEASGAAKHPSCEGQNRPHRKRIAQTAGFAKSCSGHKGFTGKMIAFSKTHMQRSLSSCDCPRKLLCITAVPNYAKTTAHGGV